MITHINSLACRLCTALAAALVLACSLAALPGRANPVAAGAPAAPAAPVLLYAAPGSQAWLAANGLLGQGPTPVQVWQQFLRRYAIPFDTGTSVERLEASTAAVLVLPSAVVLSEREKAAVLAFRARGGALLTSWQTATRDERGGSLGTAYMEGLLDLKVAGSTEKDDDDTFLIAHGDNPVSHHVAAGMRVWTERVPGWYPLRLQGRQAAAQVMDWGRTRNASRSSALVVFDERAGGAGQGSRAVTFGFPERLWQSADRALLDPLVHNALTWLLRIPDAWVPAWPHPYRSAVLLAVDLANTPHEDDLAIGKLVGALGGRASYYVLSEHAADKGTLGVLAKIKAQGHELGYLADRFEGFKDLATASQAKRLDLMIAEMAGAAIAPGAGMHPPMDLYDATTVRLAQARAIGHMVVGQDATDTRLPFFAPAPAPAAGAAPTPAPAPLVLLPRTQGGPEDVLAEGDPAVALRALLAEMELADEMAGLSVLQMLGQSTLTAPQVAAIGAHLKARSSHTWMASGSQIANWWRARTRVVATVDTASAPPVLSVTINGSGPMADGGTVWVNLPARGSVLRLAALPGTSARPAVARVDAWRDAVLLQGLAPGTYRWQLHFERVAAAAAPPSP